jgi:hypothetical protein
MDNTPSFKEKHILLAKEQKSKTYDPTPLNIGISIYGI